MIRILLIEDDISRIALFQQWLAADIHLVVASSTGKALGILQRDRGRIYSGIMLDHDLQEQIITQMDRLLSGSDLIKVIIQNISRNVPVLVHSMNVSRGPIMAEQLEAAGYMVTRIPMSVLTRERFIEWIQDVRDVWETLEG